MSSLKGNLAIGSALFITISLFLLSKSDTSQIFQNPLLSLSQIFSLIGAVLLSVTFLLSSRLRFTEDWFGSMDKSYKTHHLLGGISFILLINHPLLLALQMLPNTQFMGIYLFPSSDLVYTAGVLGIYLMISLLVLTFLFRLPYQLWLLTHEFLGGTLLLALFHVFFITSDVSRYWPLKVWILAWLLAASIAFIYKRFFYLKFGPTFHYSVSNIGPNGDYFNISLKPVSSKMNFHSGQFAFFTFNSSSLKPESHPFSLASSGSEEILRICVKQLGDFTQTLSALKIGDLVTVQGPYGGFGTDFFTNSPTVCIAGGVGITPFLSLISSPENNLLFRPVHLFYTAKTTVQAFEDSYFKKLNFLGFTYHPWFGDQVSSRLTALDIQQLTPDFSKSKFYLCGPHAMMIAFRDQLMDLGIPQRAIYFEDFDFR